MLCNILHACILLLAACDKMTLAPCLLNTQLGSMCNYATDPPEALVAHKSSIYNYSLPSFSSYILHSHNENATVLCIQQLALHKLCCMSLTTFDTITKNNVSYTPIKTSSAQAMLSLITTQTLHLLQNLSRAMLATASIISVVTEAHRPAVCVCVCVCVCMRTARVCVCMCLCVCVGVCVDACVLPY